MERNRLVLDFDSVSQKLLTSENVVALGETFDVLMRGVTFERSVTLGLFADGSGRPVWVHEGNATAVAGGCVLTGLRIATEEAQALFSGGAAFRMAALTVTTTGNGETRDYGFARVRLYAGGKPDGKYPPAELVDQVAEHNGDPEAHPDIRALILGNHDAIAAEAGARAAGDAGTLAEAKAYTDAQTARVYRFMGSVDAVEDLPDSAVDGNVYNVRADGMNYAWSAEESRWDALGPTIDLSGYATTAALKTVETRAKRGLWTFGMAHEDTPGEITNNLNNQTRGGMYRYAASCANAPVAADGILIVANPFQSNSTIHQLAISLGDARTTARIFRRARSDGAWSAWLELTTREIDDVNGLRDALADKANASALVYYLPLTGGTVTGDTTIMGTRFSNSGWLFASNIAEGGTWISAKYAAKAHNHDAADIASGTLNATRLPVATAGMRGAVAAGDGLQMGGNANAVMSVKPATATTLGGMKVGKGLSAAADGTVSATGGGDGMTVTDPDMVSLPMSAEFGVHGITFYAHDGLNRNTIFGVNDGNDESVTISTYNGNNAVARKSYVDENIAKLQPKPTTDATSYGYQAHTYDIGTTAFGGSAQAGGGYSSAFGYNAKATGDLSTAAGCYAQASGGYSTAVGYRAWTTANRCGAFGAYAINEFGGSALLFAMSEDGSSSMGLYLLANEGAIAFSFADGLSPARSQGVKISIENFRNLLLANGGENWKEMDGYYGEGYYEEEA